MEVVVKLLFLIALATLLLSSPLLKSSIMHCLTVSHCITATFSSSALVSSFYRFLFSSLLPLHLHLLSLFILIPILPSSSFLPCREKVGT